MNINTYPNTIIAKNAMLENLEKNDQLHFDAALAAYDAFEFCDWRKKPFFSIPKKYLNIIQSWEGFSLTSDGMMKYKGHNMEVE